MIDKALAQSILSDPQSYATTLLVVLARRFGEEINGIDPATVQILVKNAWGVDLPRANFNRLNAALTLVDSDIFYKDLPSFIKICDILYDGRFAPQVYDPADLLEICWGIIEALVIWPPEPDDDAPFSDEIVKYIGHQLVTEAVLRPPDVLRLGVIPERFSWSSVTNTFADDPAMFGAVEEIQHHKTENINQEIRERIAVYVQQLRTVGMEDTASVLQQKLDAMARDTR